MTLIEAKHQVANKYGFHTWAEYKTFMRNTKCTEAKKESAHDEAAELYAEWKVKNLSSNPVLTVSCRICDAKFEDEYALEAHMKFNHK